VNYELNIIPDTRIALFRWSGLITLKERKKNVEVVAQFCRENGISQLIVDTRKQVSETTTMEMYHFGAAIPKVMSGIQIAVVCRQSDRDTQFAETVAADRGAESHSVKTVEDAKKWLAGVEVTLN